MQRILHGVKGLPALGVIQRRNAGRATREIPFSPPATSLRSWTAAGLKVLHDHKIAPQFLFFLFLPFFYDLLLFKNKIQHLFHSRHKVERHLVPHFLRNIVHILPVFLRKNDVPDT